jgi:hypothetical protein
MIDPRDIRVDLICGPAGRTLRVRHNPTGVEVLGATGAMLSTNTENLFVRSTSSDAVASAVEQYLQRVPDAGERH